MPQVSRVPQVSPPLRDLGFFPSRISTASVVLPTDPSQPFGNAARNTVRGPSFWTFDVAAIKQVRLAGEARLELRVEAFNLFDRANFAPPNGNRSSGGFGAMTSTYDPRQLQLGVKVLW